MEFAIGAAIGVVIAGLFKGRKSHNPASTPVETEEQRKLQQSDEIVTVILPTISHDK